MTVPNVPCGVESRFSEFFDVGRNEFLMYRVELKDRRKFLPYKAGCRFLMYRVELKEGFQKEIRLMPCRFLMYRVELKGA